MRLSIAHRTHYTYEPAATRVALRLRLYPSTFEGQAVEQWSVLVNDDPVDALLTDGFGDQESVWTRHGASEDVEIVASGIVETTDTSGVVKGLPRRPPSGVFLRDTNLTRADDRIGELARSIDIDTTLNRMHALSDAVHAAVTYKAGATDAATTASEALRLGVGVCQDHAHVFIAAARAMGVPARYVAGYMVAGEDMTELHETHAWAEVLIEDLGWVGFDPSNAICPTDRYVRLSCGLDANQAAPVRGSIGGASEVGLSADVVIQQVQQ